MSNDGQPLAMDMLDRVVEKVNVQRIIESALANAAEQAGVHPVAIPDVIDRGLRMFSELDERGRIIAKTGTGEILYSANGEEPLSPHEWLETLRKSGDVPHLFMLRSRTLPSGLQRIFRADEESDDYDDGPIDPFADDDAYVIFIADNPQPFHIGQSYDPKLAEQIACKQCGGVDFHIAKGEYYTAIRCKACLWEKCIHDG